MIGTIFYPVGIVNVEADWATARNTYDPDPALYPDRKRARTGSAPTNRARLVRCSPTPRIRTG